MFRKVVMDGTFASFAAYWLCCWKLQSTTSCSHRQQSPIYRSLPHSVQ